jgi:hypothetical protein
MIRIKSKKAPAATAQVSFIQAYHMYTAMNIENAGSCVKEGYNKLPHRS